MTIHSEECTYFEKDTRRSLLEIRNQLAVLEEDAANIVENCDGGMFTLAMNDARKYMQFAIDAFDLILDSLPYYGICRRKDKEVSGDDDLI